MRRGFFTAEGFGQDWWASFRGRGLYFAVSNSESVLLALLCFLAAMAAILGARFWADNRVDGLGTGSAGARSGVSNISRNGLQLMGP